MFGNLFKREIKTEEQYKKYCKKKGIHYIENKKIRTSTFNELYPEINKLNSTQNYIYNLSFIEETEMSEIKKVFNVGSFKTLNLKQNIINMKYKFEDYINFEYNTLNKEDINVFEVETIEEFLNKLYKKGKIKKINSKKNKLFINLSNFHPNVIRLCQREEITELYIYSGEMELQNLDIFMTYFKNLTTIIIDDVQIKAQNIDIENMLVNNINNFKIDTIKLNIDEQLDIENRIIKKVKIISNGVENE